MNTLTTHRRHDTQRVTETEPNLSTFDELVDWALTAPDGDVLAREFTTTVHESPFRGDRLDGAALHCQACRAVSAVFIPSSNSDFLKMCRGWLALRTDLPPGDLLSVLCPSCNPEK